MDETEGVEGAVATAGAGEAVSAAPPDVPRFFGEYSLTVDEKGRVVVPPAFRSAFADGGYVSWGRDGCVCLYTPAEFFRVADEISERARQGSAASAAADAFFAASNAVTLDKQSRITVAEGLLEHAELVKTEKAVVTGAGRRIQLWNPGRWKDRRGYGLAAIANDTSLANFGY